MKFTITENKSKKLNYANMFDKYFYVFYFLILATIIFCCFYNLGKAPITDWDEARHGVNAYEMLKYNNFIANFYNGEIDYWNLKPPISYYFIILGFKIFGYNAFGLRFYSALSYILTAIIVSIFIKRKFDKKASLLFLVILLSFCNLFISHCVRRGDADALFLLFYSISFISLIKTEDNPNWIYLTGLMFSLCFLTKSWHSLILIPTVFFYLIFTKGFKRLGFKRITLFFIVSVAPIFIWAVARYQFDGFEFIKQMIKYDLLSRSSTVIEEHYGGILYYVIYLLSSESVVYCLIPIIAINILKLINKEKFSYFDIGTISAFLSVFILYTISKTKLYWYIFPCFILIAIYGSIQIVKLSKKLKSYSFIIIFLICASCLSTFNYVFSVTSNDKTQNFINSITNVSSIDLYIETETTNGWSQQKSLHLTLTVWVVELMGFYQMKTHIL